MSHEEHEINVNINIRDEREEEEEEEESGAECECNAPAPQITVTRAQTSRYKTYSPVTMAAGPTIAAIRQKLWAEFDMAEKLVPSINGEPAGDECQPSPGSRVHFAPAPKERGC